MHYVKKFNINGVDTKQVACIELHGKPNAATEGYVGVLGIDMDSPIHDVYKCVAVNGSIYTWELLSSGLSIIISDLAGSGAETVEFPYNLLKTPSLYVVKIGDSIMDGEGYVYQVVSIGASSCVATYSGVHVVKFGMSAYGLALEQGFEGTLDEWLASLEASVYIRYSAYEDGTDFTVEWSRGQRYIGICCGHTPPTQKTDLAWSRVDAGVYIGSGDMPEWCDLQIDPDGDVTEIVQTPGQSTTNVMSQKAVSDSFANALVGSASGEMVVLDDVSPIAHEMAVSVRKKNLCNIASITGEENAAGDIKLLDIKKHGTYTASADVTLYADDTATNPIFTVQVLYTDYTYSNGGYSSAVPQDGVTRRFASTVTTDSTKEIKYIRIIALNYSTQNGRHAKAENIQLEEGATATPYAPYVEDVSSVKVKALGKNLATAQQIHEGNTRYEVVEFDGRTCVKFVDNSSNSRAVIPFKPNTQYTVSFDARVVKWQDINNRIRSCLFTFFYSDGTSNNFTKDRNEAWEHCTFTSTAGKTVVGVGNTSYDSVNFNYIDINSFQLEESATATEYEPYKEPVTYAQGEPITSIYPCTTLMTDTAGAVMDVTYNKDANKVVNELAARLAALEAAVLS